MTGKIKEYIEELLSDAPRTRRTVDLQEELLSGCLEKYADLTAGGINPEDAYNEVITGIGDVNELIGLERRFTSDKRLLSPLSSSLWSLITLSYLCLGFLFEWWHPGWLIFIAGAVLQNLLTAAFVDGGKRKAALTGSLYTGATFIFLIFGLATEQWHIACLTFMLAVAIQQIARLLRVWRDDK
jgi:hypothetical protein